MEEWEIDLFAVGDYHLSAFSTSSKIDQLSSFLHVCGVLIPVKKKIYITDFQARLKDYYENIDKTKS